MIEDTRGEHLSPSVVAHIGDRYASASVINDPACSFAAFRTVLVWTDGKSDHSRERMRGLNGRDLCRAGEPQSARARRPTTRGAAFDHNPRGKFPRLPRRRRRPPADHEHAYPG